MKTAVAAMTVAAEEFVAAHPGHPGTVACCSPATKKARHCTAHSTWCRCCSNAACPRRLHRGRTDFGDRVGDMVKNGRRGTLSGRLVVKGVQGHIAYPQLARNPIHVFAPALAELVAMRWDEGNAYFLPTSWQVSNIHAGTGVGNVIPGELVVDFNFRFSTESTPSR
jgi:succinyl-diaminopimelate desuccinylase